MKIMASFKCCCGIVIERRINNDIRKIQCECGSIMNKMLSAPKVPQNTTGSSPSTNKIKYK